MISTCTFSPGYVPVSYTHLDVYKRQIYFLVMTLLFWTSYSCFSIPYYAMGASMTGDNDERTKLRMLAQIVQYVGVFFSTVAPPMFVSFFMDAGFSEGQAWHYTCLLYTSRCV